MAGAAEMLKRITLELGGNDAGIVLEGADPKAVAPKIFGAAFQNSGQVCIAMKRVYVHESIYDAMCAELAALADAAVVGDGLEQGTQLGPLQNKMQYDRVLELIEDSRSHGNIIAGGVTPEREGYFIRPTIVRDITDGTRLVDEEQFGPVLPVISYADPEDALARANASPWGLGGSIWSPDLDKAYALAERMEAGTVWINKHADITPNIPFGGAKQSGLGVELGEEGLAEFTQLQIINMAR
jgi:acyl-CoA reductase-like NAD-dependent aldehyde dehydrogenase